MHTGKAAGAVRLALEERGMSMRELSRRSGVEYHTVRNGVNDITSMQSLHFLRYCEVLDIDLQGAIMYGATSEKGLVSSEKTLQTKAKKIKKCS